MANDGNLGFGGLNSEKITNYLKNHSDYIKYREDYLIQLLFDDGVISKSELEQMKKQSLFKFDPAKNLNDSPWNTNFSNQVQNSKDVQVPFAPKKYHPVYKDLEVTDDGKIDKKQFCLDAIKEKYNSKDYDITTTEMYGVKYIIVENKKDKSAKRYEFDNVGVDIWTFDKDNRPNEYYSISNKNDLVKEHKTFDSNGEIQQTEHYDEKGFIKSVETSTKETTYVNNKPYKVRDNETGISRNLLADELIKDITAKASFNFSKTRTSIETNVLNKITPENIDEVLSSYREQSTGKELIGDIKKAGGISPELKLKLVSHIEDLALKSGTSESISVISNRIKEDISGLGTKDRINDDIKMITPQNVREVLIAFGGLNFDEALPEPMVWGIYSEVGLGEKKAPLINHILTMLEKSENGERFIDVNNDIRKHMDEPLKFRTDTRRLYTRLHTAGINDATSANGKIDSPFDQGEVGDCWLISSISSIISKPNGKKALENFLEVNKNGDVLVNLKGVGKKYLITKKEIDNAKHLVDGDGDIRAFELAIDRYFKEKNYNNVLTSEAVDLNANTVGKAYKILFGNSKFVSGANFDIKDLNNPNRAYIVAFGENKNGIFKDYIKDIATSDDNKSENIERQHGYAVSKCDDKYVYLINPNDTEKTIKMPITEFKKYCTDVGYTNFA